MKVIIDGKLHKVIIDPKKYPKVTIAGVPAHLYAFGPDIKSINKFLKERK